MFRFVVSVIAILTAATVATSATGSDVFSIQDALRQTITTNPGVGEASANRRAIELEWRQQQGVLLPQVRLDADFGNERRDLGLLRGVAGNDVRRFGNSTSVVVRQLLYDGFSSINQVWRQAARVDAAAYRVRERTELRALDAAEAYIDVTRYTRLIGLADENIAVLRRIQADVKTRFAGGRTGQGDLQQAEERVAGAIAVRYEFRLQLSTAQAHYRAVVGLEPAALRFPGRLNGLPRTKADALNIALVENATIRAAIADTRAARHDFDSTSGSFGPAVYFEGRVLRGEDTDFIAGSRDDASAKIVMTWDIFRGGIDTWRRTELSERYLESQLRESRLQRAAVELIETAWGARVITAERIGALKIQIDAARRVVQAYGSEYELGQRSLIDLLDAQNQLFNAQVSLISASGVVVFADYQLLAAVGCLLSYVRSAVPIEMAPLDGPFSLSTEVAKPVWFGTRTSPTDVTVQFVPPVWIEEAERLSVQPGLVLARGIRAPRPRSRRKGAGQLKGADRRHLLQLWRRKRLVPEFRGSGPIRDRGPHPG